MYDSLVPTADEKSLFYKYLLSAIRSLPLFLVRTVSLFTMNQSLTTTAFLNNQAIDHMSRGEYLDAAGKLTRSLHIVKGLMGIVRWEDDAQAQDDTRMQAETSNGLVFCAPSERKNEGRVMPQSGGEHDVVHEMSMALEHAPQQLQQAVHADLCKNDATCHCVLQPFVYDTPLQICPDALYHREFNHELLSELSVALMFNLALCHHLRALRTFSKPSDGANILGQAVSLYELAYEVQMQEDVELSIECTMAIINNLGQLHQRLGDEGKASKCFSHLLSTLLFVQSSSTYDDKNDKREISSASSEGFVKSVSHLVLSKNVAAAA